MASLCLPGIEKGNRYKYYLNLNHSENAIKYLSQNPDNIIWSILSANPYAFDLLMENKELIYWPSFCINPNPKIIDILLQNPKKIYWSGLSSNSVAIELLLQNKDKINYTYLIDNENAYEVIKEYLETQFILHPSLAYYSVKKHNKQTYIQNLCSNKNKNLIQYLYINYPDDLDWFKLSTNSAAIDIILENKHKISYIGLSANTHPKAIELLKKTPLYINWDNFGAHITEYALIAEHNPMLKEWIWSNPIIFDYKAISKYKMDKIKEELIQKTLHPKRIQRWLEQGVEIDDL